LHRSKLLSINWEFPVLLNHNQQAMEHIFDNHHVLQSLVVKAGYKKSIYPCSNKYHLTFDDVEKFFFANLNDSEIIKIKESPSISAINGWSREKIISLCKIILEDTVLHCTASFRYGPEKMSLREVAMERVATMGCAYTIVFLKKYYWKNEVNESFFNSKSQKTSNDLQQFKIIINKVKPSANFRKVSKTIAIPLFS